MVTKKIINTAKAFGKNIAKPNRTIIVSQDVAPGNISKNLVKPVDLPIWANYF